MPSPAPEPLSPRPLTIWLVNPFDDIPGEGPPPLRTWTLARVLAARGHDVTWWTATWSHRRKAIRSALLNHEDLADSGELCSDGTPFQRAMRMHRVFGNEALASPGLGPRQLGQDADLVG